MTKGTYIYVPKSTLILPVSSGFFKVYKDYWWLVKDQDLVFYEDLNYPQANSRKEMLVYLGSKLKTPHTAIEQIPFVYTPLNLKDYMP